MSMLVQSITAIHIDSNVVVKLLVRQLLLLYLFFFFFLFNILQTIIRTAISVHFVSRIANTNTIIRRSESTYVVGKE